MPSAATITLDELVPRLKDAFGAELRGVVLYGSAAAGEHIPDRSDFNVLVLVDSLSLDRLRAAGAVTQSWTRAGNPAPLTLTLAEWASSADIFPMEYADVLERHRVLYGVAPMDGIRVSHADLRLQVEQQAMGKLLQLRQGILQAGDDTAAQASLLAASLSAVMIVFRAVARLHGVVPPAANDALSSQVAQLAGLDSEPFVRVVRHVRHEQELKGSGVTLVLGAYLAGLERLVAHVNRFTPTAA